jgi:ABC-type Fe3+/spermidine/putrescine transport system ATPase subunit
MSMGRVEQIGSPRSVYRSPCNRFVAGFIGEANLFAGTVLAVEGEFAWDGLRQDGRRADIGIYVIYFEVFNLSLASGERATPSMLAGGD